MNIYNLIFSDVGSVRVRRHLLFWIAWWFYLTMTYLIPTNWIPGWNIYGPMEHIHKYGAWYSFLRILMAGVLHTLIHVALVYGILYYILPRYISERKNWLVTTFLLLVLFCVVAFLNYFNFVLALNISTRIGYFKSMPGMDFILPLWGRQVLFNYPTVVGFALAIKLLKNWYLKQEEATLVAREKIKAELQLLKAQVHPHFLFNTLNNIYSFIINESPAAPQALKKLSSLLRYMIYECNKPLVNLEKEINMISGYIDLEKIRYGENFNMCFEMRGNAAGKNICPLLLVPFLENSFKHGASQMLTHPWVNLKMIIEEQYLFFDLSNSKPTIMAEPNASKGLGLNNVKKQLGILYPQNHSLTIREDPMSFHVSLKIPLFKPDENPKQSAPPKQIYELA